MSDLDLNATAIESLSILAVLVPHPIQPLTREEVRALAVKVFDAILNRITA